MSPGLAQISPRGSIANGSLADNRWIPLPVAGELQDAAFSHDGSWIYAWSRDKGFNYWYIWQAYNGQIYIRGNSRFVCALPSRLSLTLTRHLANRAPMGFEVQLPPSSFHSHVPRSSSLAMIEVLLP